VKDKTEKWTKRRKRAGEPFSMHLDEQTIYITEDGKDVEINIGYPDYYDSAAWLTKEQAMVMGTALINFATNGTLNLDGLEEHPEPGISPITQEQWEKMDPIMRKMWEETARMYLEGDTNLKWPDADPKEGRDS